MIFLSISGAPDRPVVRWCQKQVGWSGGAEERAMNGKARKPGPGRSLGTACFYSFLGFVMLISEKGLILEGWSTVHPVSKTE